MVWLALVGCGWLPEAPLPEGLGPDAVRVQVRDQAMEVQAAGTGEVLGRVGWEELEVDPVDASDRRLVEAMEGATGLWAELPASLPWYRARKVLGSAAEAGVEPVLLSVAGASRVLRLGEEAPIRLRMSCPGGALPWTGGVPRITLALQRSAEGTWAVAHARFLPVIDGVPTEGLPASCLAPATCAVRYLGADLQACEAGRAAPVDGRVALGGEVGCLLPFLNHPDELHRWTAELPRVLRRLGLHGTEPVVVSPEARVRWDAVLAVLGAFEDAGLPIPALGKPLVEGNDGPPLCDAEVRDAASLSAVGARRAGAWMAMGQEER